MAQGVVWRVPWTVRLRSLVSFGFRLLAPCCKIPLIESERGWDPRFCCHEGQAQAAGLGEQTWAMPFCFNDCGQCDECTEEDAVPPPPVPVVSTQDDRGECDECSEEEDAVPSPLVPVVSVQDDCGKCDNCRDKEKFCGHGLKKVSCKLKLTCTHREVGRRFVHTSRGTTLRGCCRASLADICTGPRRSSSFARHAHAGLEPALRKVMFLQSMMFWTSRPELRLLVRDVARRCCPPGPCR